MRQDWWFSKTSLNGFVPIDETLIGVDEGNSIENVQSAIEDLAK
jgi:hypothetical protein